MNAIKSMKVRRDTKRVFFKKGTCSRTFFYLLNREYGFPHENEERAADPLAGGILQQGYQCGMLWGAALGLGAEAYRRCGDRDRATNMAIKATQNISESFIARAKSSDCADITNCDFGGKMGLSKFLITGKFLSCFKLADKWAPEAFKSAAEGLSLDQNGLPAQPMSCASEVVRRMGGSDQEMVMVAGFAGGLGLSGNACGALSAAIWINTLTRIKGQSYKMSFSDPLTEKMLSAFYEASGYEMECQKICGRCFATINEHTEFVKSGGCQKLIQTLADTKSF